MSLRSSVFPSTLLLAVLVLTAAGSLVAAQATQDHAGRATPRAHRRHPVQAVMGLALAEVVLPEAKEPSWAAWIDPNGPVEPAYQALAELRVH